MESLKRLTMGRELSLDVNISDTERRASLLAGGAAFVIGLARAPKTLPLSLAGLPLIYRGLTGHSYLYGLLGRRGRSHMARHAWSGGPGIRLQEAITINRPVPEVYQRFRQLEGLAGVLSHVESIRSLGERRSHWVVKAPGPVPVKVEWDVEIVEERENQLLTWRSLPGSEVDLAGSLYFRPAPGDRGTEMRLLLAYSPPGGAVGTVYGRLVNSITAQQIREDLRRLKHNMEAGEVPVNEPQPAGAGRSRSRTVAPGCW